MLPYKKQWFLVLLVFFLGHCTNRSYDYGKAKTSSSLLRLAHRLEDGKDYVMAARFYKEALEQGKYSQDFYIEYFSFLLRLGQAQAALNLYETHPPLFEKPLSFKKMILKAYFMEKRTEDGVELTLKLIDSYPENIELYNYAGLFYGLKKDYEKALSFLKRGLNIDPQSKMLRSSLAITFVLAGQHDMGIKKLNTLANDSSASQKDHENLKWAKDYVVQKKI